MLYRHNNVGFIRNHCLTYNQVENVVTPLKAQHPAVAKEKFILSKLKEKKAKNRGSFYFEKREVRFLIIYVYVKII